MGSEALTCLLTLAVSVCISTTPSCLLYLWLRQSCLQGLVSSDTELPPVHSSSRAGLATSPVQLLFVTFHLVNTRQYFVRSLTFFLITILRVHIRVHDRTDTYTSCRLPRVYVDKFGELRMRVTFTPSRRWTISSLMSAVDTSGVLWPCWHIMMTMMDWWWMDGWWWWRWLIDDGDAWLIIDDGGWRWMDNDDDSRLCCVSWLTVQTYKCPKFIDFQRMIQNKKLQLVKIRWGL